MFRVIVFGQVELRDAEGRSLSHSLQRRPLAVLIVLAVAGASGISRDRLLALLWPEKGDAQARNSLRQAVHQLRKTLGESVVTGAMDLHLNPHAITSDVGDFEAAVKAGDNERAVTFYAGALGDGFHVRGAPELEDWLSAHRARLKGLFAASVELAASEANSWGEHARAAVLWQRVVRDDPLNSRSALDLATALAKSGNRAGALDVLAAHQELLASELGLPQDDRLCAFRSELLSAPQNATELAHASAQAFSVDLPPSADSRAPARTQAVQEAQPVRLRSRVFMIPLLCGIGALGLFVAFQAHVAEGNSNPTAKGGMRMAVAPFEIEGDTSAAFLSEGVSEMLAGFLGSVRGEQLVQTVHPKRGESVAAAAHRIGARLYVTGRVMTEGDLVSVSANLWSPDGGDVPVASASATARRGNVLSTVATLGADLSAPFLGPGAGTRIKTAALGTTSEAALREFITGEANFRASRYLDAATAFGNAVLADSNFAMAWYRLAVSLDWSGRPISEVLAAARRAHELAARLPDVDRRMIEAHYAWRTGKADEAERLYRSILEQRRGDPEATYLLAELLFHENPLRGRSIQESAPLFQDLFSADSTDREALLHLERLAQAEHRFADADRFERRIIALAGRGEMGTTGYFRALVIGSPADFAILLDSARKQSSGQVGYLVTRGLIYADVGERASRVAALLTVPERPLGDRIQGTMVLLQIAAGRGRLREASSFADRLQFLSEALSVEERASLALFPGRADSVASLAQSWDELRRWVPKGSIGRASVDDSLISSSAFRQYLLGEVALARGDNSAAQAELRSLRNWSEPRTAATTRDLEQALQVSSDAMGSKLTRAPVVGSNQIPIPVARARERFQAARGMERAGRLDEALRLYQTFELTDMDGALYAAPGHLARARLLASAGKTVEARADLARARYLWRDADPELQALLNRFPSR